jgi:hypothetical protein
MGFRYTDTVFNIRSTKFEAEQDGKNFTLSYTGIDHAVLNVLANRANNETGVCWPGYGLIAEDTHFSRRAVMRSVAKLEQFGFITSELIGERSTNTYTLHMERLVAASLLTPAKNRGMSKKLRGKRARNKHDLYPPNLECDKCSKSPTECSCTYWCEEGSCGAESHSLAGHLHHSYVTHGLKVQPVRPGHSMRLGPVATLADGKSASPKSYNIEDDEDGPEIFRLDSEGDTEQLEFIDESRMPHFNLDDDEHEPKATPFSFDDDED